MENSNLIPFEGKEIRKVIHNDEWYFSIIDVIAVLTDSPSPKTYWAKLKDKEFKANGQSFPFTEQLKLMSSDGKKYKTDCANTDGIFRIIMSVPSPKAEPLKMWLAEQGARTLEETANPELLTQRQIELYKLKGRSDEWIKERMQSIETRTKLTDEWKNRGVQEGREYSILTAIIAKGTFGISPAEHKEIKGLSKPNQNLRDHMTDLELVFTSLGEVLTRNEIIKDDSQGFDENKIAAVKGGSMAGDARKMIEKRSGKKVVSSENFLKAPNDTKELSNDE
jgi:DNA-damage-inducible protein D